MVPTTADDVDAASLVRRPTGHHSVLPQSANRPTCAYTESSHRSDEDELNGSLLLTPFPAEAASHHLLAHRRYSHDVHRLVAHGACSPPTERGGGFLAASIVDPFGNTVGIMHSPHWRARH